MNCIACRNGPRGVSGKENLHASTYLVLKKSVKRYCTMGDSPSSLHSMSDCLTTQTGAEQVDERQF